MNTQNTQKLTGGAHAPKWKRALHATGIELSKDRGYGFDESFATLKGCAWETAGEIVCAVNAHAALVAALQNIDETYDRVSRLPMPMELVSAIMQARKALAELGLTNPQHMKKEGGL